VRQGTVKRENTARVPMMPLVKNADLDAIRSVNAHAGNRLNT
jgi:hypothetical protein